MVSLFSTSSDSRASRQGLQDMSAPGVINHTGDIRQQKRKSFLAESAQNSSRISDYLLSEKGSLDQLRQGDDRL